MLRVGEGLCNSRQQFRDKTHMEWGLPGFDTFPKSNLSWQNDPLGKYFYKASSSGSLLVVIIHKSHRCYHAVFRSKTQGL